MRLPGTIIQGILARAALSFLRIYLGGVLVLAGWSSLQSGYATAAALVPWSELLLGSMLVLGLMTRLAAAGVIALTVADGLAGGSMVWSLSSAEAARACVAVALIIGAAGRTFGLDSLLARWWVRSPFW
jgi:uncharacterized membrane protein YphA (DoxX/SURF4 family)